LLGAVAVTLWTRQRRRLAGAHGSLRDVTDVGEVLPRLAAAPMPALGLSVEPEPAAVAARATGPAEPVALPAPDLNPPVGDTAELAGRLMEAPVQAAERSLRGVMPVDAVPLRVGDTPAAEAAALAPMPEHKPAHVEPIAPSGVSAPATAETGTVERAALVAEGPAGAQPGAVAEAMQGRQAEGEAPRSAPIARGVVTPRIPAAGPAAAVRPRGAERPPMPLLDGPVQLGPPVTVPGAPHRLGTLLREKLADPAVGEVGDLAALLRGEVERVRRQFGEPAGMAPGVEPSVAEQGLVIDFDPWLDGPVPHQPALMRRAVRNLLKAAAERASRHVVLSARIEGGVDVVVEVDDDGAIVMDDEPTPGDSPRPATPPGVAAAAGEDDGGLAFVSSVAQWHGGRTGMERSPLGGVRCILRWPVRIEAAGVPTSASVVAARASPGPHAGPDRRQKPPVR
jgi:hypothetical protein